MSDIHPITTEGPQAERPGLAGRRTSARNKKREPVPAPAHQAPPPEYQSETLLAGGEEALILHREEVYRLRKTWTGKLILTK